MLSADLEAAWEEGPCAEALERLREIEERQARLTWSSPNASARRKRLEAERERALAVLGMPSEAMTYAFGDGTVEAPANDRFTLTDENGEPHSDGGEPAVVEWDGTMRWYRHGTPHREDGPAVICPDGNVSWMLDGEEVSPGDVLAMAVDRVEREIDGEWGDRFPGMD